MQYFVVVLECESFDRSTFCMKCGRASYKNVRFSEESGFQSGRFWGVPLYNHIKKQKKKLHSILIITFLHY